MKSQRVIFKWIAIVVVLGMFLSFAVRSPSVLAQEESPPLPEATSA